MIDVECRKEYLVQNSLTSKCPDFATIPCWYMSGLEKKVKVGRISFNYIDYLEAWEHHDCGTHRSYYALSNIRDRIEAAFLEVESELHKSKNQNYIFSKKK